ncbi:MAG: hypothetical protein WC794_02205 [Candidatus Doudnabacteria bacterium]
MKINKKIYFTIFIFSLIVSFVFTPAKKTLALTTQQIQDGFNSCVDQPYGGETEQEAIVRCCQDSDWKLAPICSATISTAIDKCLSKTCDVGYTCNAISGECVANPSNPTPPVNNPPATPPTTEASGGACINTGKCPEGLCELNGLCLPKASGSVDSFVGKTTLVGLLLKIIQFLLTFAGVVAVGVLVIGGFWYITSAGNEEQAEKGQKAITNAIIGLVVVILAYTIVAIISSTLIADKFVK